MDYDDFKEKVGEELDVPTDEQVELLVEGRDTIHLQVIIGYVLENHERISIPFVTHGEEFTKALDLLQKRGAVRGQDYIICAYPVNSRVMATIHTINSFICDEDIV